MGRGHNCLAIFLIFLLLHSATEARPLGPSSQGHLLKEIDGVFRPVSSSGPSAPGGGHKFKKLKPLGETKYSGPSPGAGHKFVTDRQQQLTTPSSTVP